MAPDVAFGFTGMVGVRLRESPPQVSLSLEARGDLDAGRGAVMRGEQYALRTAFAGGSLVPCLHGHWLMGCGLLTVGAVRSTVGADTTPEERTALYAGAGVRAGLEVPVSALLRLKGPAVMAQVTGDFLVNMAQPGITIGGDVAWRVAAVSEAAGVRIVVIF
jgi:hypothetical protein